MRDVVLKARKMDRAVTCRGAQGCSQECLEAELLKEEEIPAMARALILWLPHTPFVAIGKKPN